MNIQVCRDTSDAVALYLPQRLYLKSFAKLNISVQLPSVKVHGKSISNWELMEKLRKIIHPESFSLLKVSKHSSEVIRFDAELECRTKLERVIQRLDERVVQLTDYPDPLKVRVAECKQDFPSRHSWDSFFRDATDMDEMKPGERPDTIHIANLPIRWFVSSRDRDEDAPPSESIFKKVFEKFGAVRQIDVPAADPFRMQMKTTMRGITTPPQDQALYFEGYVQFSEYVAFVRCMDALRGRKLLRKQEELVEWCGLRVDFDKTKHMTDAAVKRRAIVRERLTARQRAKDEEERQTKDKMAKKEANERLQQNKVEIEKFELMRQREERRKKKQLAKLMAKDNVDVDGLFAEEEQKLVKAQRKLQAVRLIEELFKRIELRPARAGRAGRAARAGRGRGRGGAAAGVRRRHEQRVERQRERLRQARDGRIVIRSALETKKPKPRTASISSVSSDELNSYDRRGGKTEKLNTPEREMAYKKAVGVWGAGPLLPAAGFGFGFPPPYPPHAPHHNLYYPPPQGYYARGAGGAGGGDARRPRRGRGRGRGLRMPYFEGPDATHHYYRYFKRLTEYTHRAERSRSRSRSRRRSYSRSRSRSRRRSYTRSRSRSRRSRSRSRSRTRTRTRSRTRTRTRSRSRSRSRGGRSRSRSRRSRSHKSRSRSRPRRPARAEAEAPAEAEAEAGAPSTTPTKNE